MVQSEDPLNPPPGSRRNPLRMNSRMDTRLPRPAARSGRPEGLQPAAPPPDVERPAREKAKSGLEVIFPSRYQCWVLRLSFFLNTI